MRALIASVSMVLAGLHGSATHTDQQQVWDVFADTRPDRSATDISITSRTQTGTSSSSAAIGSQGLRCLWFFNLTPAEAYELVGRNNVLSSEIPVGDSTITFNAAWCNQSIFGPSRYFLWLVGDPIPHEIVQALARHATAQAQPPVPTVQSTPDGTATPYLVNLPVWWHLPDTQTYSGTATIPGLSVTAVLTPNGSTWHSSHHAPIHCEQTASWRPGAAPGSATYCGAVFTQPGSVTITVEVPYRVELICTPTSLCAGIAPLPPVETATSFTAEIAYLHGLRTLPPEP